MEWSKDYGKKEITSYVCYSLDNISVLEERLKKLKTDMGIDSYLTGIFWEKCFCKLILSV